MGKLGKFRSKLTRHGKGKQWGKGQSSTSNPTQMKHRLKAKSRFFQPNLSLAPPAAAETPGALTLEAVMKHDQRQAYNAETTTVNDVARSLRSFNIDDEVRDDDEEDENMSESQRGGSFKTFKTFASNYSSCTNMSFKKLLCGFRTSSELHKEMLAILTALTEIIKERGGTESSTEYFILLMEQIEASQEEQSIVAGVTLMGMGIKSVPAPVLRKSFASTAQTFLGLLQRYAESSNTGIIRQIIGCLSVLLRAQEYATWSYSSTWPYIDAILSFTVHSKPKIRKAAQHAIASIVQGSCFMLPPPKMEEDHADIDPSVSSSRAVLQRPTSHPASGRITKFCLRQFHPEILANSQTTVLHILTMLKDILGAFKTDDIRSICEHLLSIMTASNVLVRTNCFQALHSLFVSRSPNLSGSLCAKLLAAIHEYRPDRSDIRQSLAWLTVLKEGHIHLADLDLGLCINALPRLMDICANDLWLSDRSEIIGGVANCLKELLHDCVKPACVTAEEAAKYRRQIGQIIESLHKTLSAPFGEVAKYVILTFSIVFEVCGEHFASELGPSLLLLAERYDTENSLRVHIEHSIIAAVKSMGVERALQTVPLINAKGEIILERSWLLPLLREGTTRSSFEFFKRGILSLALHCNTKWHEYAAQKQVSLAHTYELLCCQLWGLFPGFCRQPTDPEFFRSLAPTLGNALESNPEFRAPLLDGFIELIQNESEENEAMRKQLGVFAKNFLPRLFNIYTTKPKTTYEGDMRKKTFELIKLYLSITPEEILKELFDKAKTKMASETLGTFSHDSIFDIICALVLFQTSESIKGFFESHMIPVLKNEKSKLVSKDEQILRKQQRKTYELLRDLLNSESACCQKFKRKNLIAIQQLLLDAFNTSCAVCQAARLKCLKLLIESRKNLTYNDKIVMKTIPEAVITYKEFSTRKENISEELVTLVANLFEEAGKLNDFVDILTAGLAGDESLITNTILAFRTVVQHHGKSMTIATLEFILEQISVFLVQKSRSQAEACVAFLITFIKVMPAPLVANHLETIMKSLSAMMKDTKRFCRIQLGYLLKKLCKRFTAEELIKFVPGDDEVTHRRLKKIRKQMRRESRKKLTEDKSSGDDSDGEEFVPGLEKKSVTIDDILADSDSDLPMDAMDVDEPGEGQSKTKSRKKPTSMYIREDPEDIVDLADIKSVGHVLTNRPDLPSDKTAVGAAGKKKTKDPNRGFKTADDGRLIIDDKALRGRGGASDDDDDEDDSGSDGEDDEKQKRKRGMEEDSSDEEAEMPSSSKRKNGLSDAVSMRSGKTSASRYTAGGRGIHRPLGKTSGTFSVKSGFSAKTSAKSTAKPGSEFSSRKAKGDMKSRGKVDPYAYIPLSRNVLNKRKRAKNAGTFKNIVKGAKKGALKGVKNRVSKRYKK